MADGRQFCLPSAFSGAHRMEMTVWRVGDGAIPEDITSFISGHPQAGWFNCHSFIPPPAIQGNSEILLFVARNQKGVIGVIVANLYYRRRYRRELVGPFRLQINGAPLLTSTSDRISVFGLLLQEVNRIADTLVPVVEFRNFPYSGEEMDALLSAGYQFFPHLNLIKHINSEAEVWQSMSKCRHRQIRKAIGNGATVEPAGNDARVRQFYAILRALYINKVHKKLPSCQTFLDFFHRSRSDGTGEILVVVAEGKVIGGIVCLIEPGKSLIEWYICGLDIEYRKYYPSVMATWGGIQLAGKLGLPVFNFLGLGRPDIPYGVRDFKLRFGGIMENYGRLVREQSAWPNIAIKRK